MYMITCKRQKDEFLKSSGI